jgi:transcriptional regulator with XRE-family HTH domain
MDRYALQGFVIKKLSYYAIIVSMRTDKNHAIELRKQGKSYTQICEELRVAKSTLSNWFHGTDFSEAIRQELTKKAIDASTVHIEALNKARGDTLVALYERAETEALQEIETYKHSPLFLIAVATYWGEGDKSSKNQVRLTNTDQKMLRIFLNFLIEICLVPKEKIRVALFIYEDLDEKECRNYWSKNLDLSHFHKTMILPSRHKTKRLPYGTCTIIVSNSYLKKKMLVWIDQLPKIILNR